MQIYNFEKQKRRETIMNINKTLIVWGISIVSCSLVQVIYAGNFTQELQKQRMELERNITMLIDAGNGFLLTGASLNGELIHRINTELTNLETQKKSLEMPYSVVLEPFKAFEDLVHQNNSLSASMRATIIKMLQDPLFQKAYNTLFDTTLKVAKIPSVPDVLRNIMALLDKVETNMKEIKGRFEPIIEELHTYIDVEQAKKDLMIPESEGLFQRLPDKTEDSAITLAFIERYPEYVQQQYARKMPGAIFDTAGIYSGLIKAKNNFQAAARKLKNVEDFLNNIEQGVGLIQETFEKGKEKIQSGDINFESLTSDTKKTLQQGIDTTTSILDSGKDVAQDILPF